MSKLKVIRMGIQKGALLAKKYSPEIFLGVGTVGVIVSTVGFCKRGTRAAEIAEESKMSRVLFAQTLEENTDEIYSEKDYENDCRIDAAQTAWEYVKLYAPPVIGMGVSLGLIFQSHNIMRQRNAALVAAYKAVDEAFKKYRSRVVDELGKEKDIEFLTGRKVVDVVDEEGNTVKKVVNQGETTSSMYAKFFDENSEQYTKNADANYTFLYGTEQRCNLILNKRGHIFLNEVYDLFGLPHTHAGAQVGWLSKEFYPNYQGDGYVSIGLFDGTRSDERLRSFINGYETSVLLDFNVDGVIWDLIRQEDPINF